MAMYRSSPRRTCFGVTAVITQRLATATILVAMLLAASAVPGPAVAQTRSCWPDPPTMDTGIAQWPRPPRMVIDPDGTYSATLVTNRGAIVIALDAAKAPVTVNNFVCLARAGYYNVTLFHRVIQGFMIQGGDPSGTGRGGPGYQFQDELPTGDLPYTRGTMAMANAGADTNGSQFFIVQVDQPEEFPSSYSVFGQVTDGMDVVDAIAGMPVAPNALDELSSPLERIGVNMVTITEDERRPPPGNPNRDDRSPGQAWHPAIQIRSRRAGSLHVVRPSPRFTPPMQSGHITNAAQAMPAHGGATGSCHRAGHRPEGPNAGPPLRDAPAGRARDQRL